MSRFLSERLAALNAYTPGEQPQDMNYIKLNTNESPYPPSLEVIAAVNADEAKNLRLYSDPTCKSLKKAMAKAYGLKTENIYLSNGSDDILNFAFMAYGYMGAVYPEISYGFYPVFSQLYSIESEAIPLKSDFSIDPTDYYGKNKLVVIANPNAPTGLILSTTQIEKILLNNQNGVVVIDEAYIDFGGESCYNLISKYNNLLVVRTFSKSRSMAGARLGFAFGAKDLIEDLEKLKYSTNPYDINRITQAAGEAALLNPKYYLDNCRKIINTRAKVTEELQKMGFTVTNSMANFIFAKSDRISGEDFYLELKKRGVLIRHFSIPKIKDYNRITIGSADEMRVFIEKTKEIMGGINL